MNVGGQVTGLNNFVEDAAILVQGAPQPPLLAVDRDHDLIEMPYVAAPQ